jgi:hypothetical protein
MKSRHRYCLLYVLLCSQLLWAQQKSIDLVEKRFTDPPASAKPWVFWYWMNAAVSKQGITADLEAMKQVGIGGAYLMPIKDTTSPPLYQPTARQLTPEWWSMVNFAMKEAKRLNLQLALHVSDGFALAGGPWITPELSMQKLVWTKTYIMGGGVVDRQLSKPTTTIDYYKDIAIFAYPANSSNAFAEIVSVPSVMTSNGIPAPFLCFEGDDKQSFKSDTSCWIQYKYPEPFTCRSVRIHVGGNNYQAQRLIVQTSNDGVHFDSLTRLDPPRHGWQDTGEDVTYSIPAKAARYFRFVYNKEGSEPGSEDLDAAKWKPSFKVNGIYLSDEPVIHQYESKNGSIWRVSRLTTIAQVPNDAAIPLNRIINITDKIDSAGRLRWSAPPGNWVIVRIGHTSTGHTNATGGGGKGLECDKFNPVAVKKQFDNWFAKVFEKTDPGLAKEVVKIFHVDSWECGSQNWSSNFRKEFTKRRGYDPLPFLIAMTGVPVQSAEVSEKFLHDVRETIAALVNDNFYVTLKNLAKAKGCQFSAEAIAPTMVSDGLLHYKNVDLPMGEFWLNSPTHDKPNDMLDAISGAHIYGKNIIQAEAFTSVRMNWNEHPGNMKAVGDRNFAMGINKMVLHVFTHNPWMDRKPGMTLDGVGLYFQRDQTWFKQSKAWIDYLTRCQALLQMGKPVVDIAVFTGEEVPRRSILPDRLVNTLPGIFGKERVESEKKRLANVGQPLRSIPDGVNHSANMADPENWVNALNGYKYDCINPDALLSAKVVNGKIVLPGGASYAILVIPSFHPMQPDSNRVSLAIAKKIQTLINAGAAVILNPRYIKSNRLSETDAAVEQIMKQIAAAVGKKRVFMAPFHDSTFNKIGVEQDVGFVTGNRNMAWTHRQYGESEIYFFSNPADTVIRGLISLRVRGKMMDVYDPVTGRITSGVTHSDPQSGRTLFPFSLYPGESIFLITHNKESKEQREPYVSRQDILSLYNDDWQLQFDPAYGGPAKPVTMKELESWTESNDSSVKYYSGTVIYTNKFSLPEKNSKEKVILNLKEIHNIATIKINGIECGTLWTQPYRLDITNAVKEGINEISIEVTNTWANRLIGDQRLPVERRVTWTTAPFRLANKPLRPAGLLGYVVISVQYQL